MTSEIIIQKYKNCCWLVPLVDHWYCCGMGRGGLNAIKPLDFYLHFGNFLTFFLIIIISTCKKSFVLFSELSKKKIAMFSFCTEYIYSKYACTLSDNFCFLLSASVVWGATVGFRMELECRQLALGVLQCILSWSDSMVLSSQCWQETWSNWKFY